MRIHEPQLQEKMFERSASAARSAIPFGICFARFSRRPPMAHRVGLDRLVMLMPVNKASTF